MTLLCDKLAGFRNMSLSDYFIFFLHLINLPFIISQIEQYSFAVFPEFARGKSTELLVISKLRPSMQMRSLFSA